MLIGLWVLLAFLAFASAVTLDSDLENLVNDIEREVDTPSEEVCSSLVVLFDELCFSSAIRLKRL